MPQESGRIFALITRRALSDLAPDVPVHRILTAAANQDDERED